MKKNVWLVLQLVVFYWMKKTLVIRRKVKKFYTAHSFIQKHLPKSILSQSIRIVTLQNTCKQLILFIGYGLHLQSDQFHLLVMSTFVKPISCQWVLSILPWNICFLMFPGGRDKWHEMGWSQNKIEKNKK